MDLTVNPCQDFYKFSCGGWEKMLSDSPPAIFSDTDQIIHKFKLMNKGIKKDVLGIGAYISLGNRRHLKSIQIIQFFSELLQEDRNNNSNNAFKKARKMYQSCMNTG